MRRVVIIEEKGIYYECDCIVCAIIERLQQKINDELKRERDRWRD
jgi:hypothetical protein